MDHITLRLRATNSKASSHCIHQSLSPPSKAMMTLEAEPASSQQTCLRSLLIAALEQHSIGRGQDAGRKPAAELPSRKTLFGVPWPANFAQSWTGSADAIRGAQDSLQTSCRKWHSSGQRRNLCLTLLTWLVPRRMRSGSVPEMHSLQCSVGIQHDKIGWEVNPVCHSPSASGLDFHVRYFLLALTLLSSIRRLKLPFLLMIPSRIRQLAIVIRSIF